VDVRLDAFADPLSQGARQWCATSGWHSERTALAGL
jgi:hypothetical protein